ncbi:MAG: NAD(P)/FAD-dependent oxidoreductase [Lachnospiraceae bacterium]
MIQINQIKLSPDHTEQDLIHTIKKKLHIKNEKFQYKIVKRSIDGRKKPYVKYVYSCQVHIRGLDLKQEQKLVQKVHDNNVVIEKELVYHFPKVSALAKSQKIVIVGSGPAGLFCGLMLAREGLHPLIIERGECVERRKKIVEHFWESGELDENCNVQFGEGGAGTFSDGKLNTQVKETSGRIRKVLDTFVEFGAGEEILYSNKPHIGTDVLMNVVHNMREEILRLGGEILFNTKMIDLCIDDKESKIKGIVVSKQDESSNWKERVIPCDRLVLALGHSARDTFKMLYERHLTMEAKPFAVGVRVEHPQQMIDDYEYGENIYELPAASYKVTYRATQEERGVYSFCMCPGGYVVNASSEKNRLCINGMSYSDRGGKNANSAIVVTVRPEDYGKDHPLAGIEFQRQLEDRAFLAGKGKIPCQTYGSFKEHTLCGEWGKVQPNTKGAVEPADLHEILPEYICEPIIKGMEHFARQIPDFNREDAILLAVESRTSSPLRILRNEKLMSNVGGIYPCGEGAGYAGGITSAAVDGIRVAEALASIEE